MPLNCQISITWSLRPENCGGSAACKQTLIRARKTLMILIYKRECALTLLALLAWAPGMCGQHLVTVDVDATLEHLEITVRPAAAVSRLGARSERASRYVDDVSGCNGEHLEARGRHIESRKPLGCFRYRIDLRSAAASDRRNATLDRNNVLVSPSLWLWRPLDRRRADTVVAFRLPEGTAVSAPWQSLGDNRYRIRPSPRSASAAVAFGAFHAATREVPGATLDIAMMKPRGDRAPLQLLDWVASAASNVALGYGRFPNPEPHVVVIPVGGSRRGSSSPVPFGRVIRDGGESVELFVNQNAALDRFYADWTATHEFSHFMLPYVSWRQRWISEGFAQYYQNVLLARAGQYDTRRAWQKLYEGFERGRRARPELSPNEATEQRPHGATMKIYWSGAALAFEADVELRRRSGGTRSLDTVLEEFAVCCLPSAETWSGRRLFRALDDIAGDAVFMPLYDRYANAEGFPDYRAVMEALGLDVRGGRIIEADDAALASIRDAIMSPPPPAD